MLALSHSDQSPTGHSDFSVGKQPHSKRSHLHSMNWYHLGQYWIFSTYQAVHSQPHPYTQPPSYPRELHVLSSPGKKRYLLVLSEQIQITFPAKAATWTCLQHCRLSYLSGQYYTMWLCSCHQHNQTHQQLSRVSVLDGPQHAMTMWNPTTTSHDVAGLISEVMCSTV